MIEALQKSKLAIITSAIIGLSTVGIEPAQAASFRFSFGDLASGFLSYNDFSLTRIGRESFSLSQTEGVIFEWYGKNLSYGLNSNDVNFSFENGYLVGIDLEGIYDARYIPPEQCHGTCSIDVKDVIVARGDRYAAVKSGSESNSYSIGRLPESCDTGMDENGYYYICKGYESAINYSYQAGEEGVSQLVDGYNLETFTYIYYDGYVFRYETNDLPMPQSYFTAYGNLPKITFTTIEPPIPGAVPEPLTIIGTGMAAGFGAFFKKSLSQRRKRDK